MMFSLYQCLCYADLYRKAVYHIY